MAAIEYVDPSVAGPGTGTELDPWKLISSAIASVDDGGTIKLIAGTYDETTQGPNWEFEFTGTAKGMTIEPNVAGTTITVDSPTAARMFEFSSVSASSKTIIIKNISYTTTNAGTQPIRRTSNADATLIFEDCNISGIGCNFFYYLQGGNVGTTKFVRTTTAGSNYMILIGATCNVDDIVFEDSDCSHPSGLLRTDGDGAEITNIIIDGGTITNNDNGYVFFNDYLWTVENLIIDGATINPDNGLLYRPHRTPNYTRIINCTWLNTDPTAGDNAIDFGYGYNDVIGKVEPELLGDWTTDVNGNAVAVNDVCINDDEMYKCHQEHTASATDEPGVGANWKQYWEVAELGKVDVINNTITHTADDQKHCILLSFGCAPGSTVIGNTCSKGDWQIVIKSKAAFVFGNKTSDGRGISVFSGDNNLIMNNSVYTDSNHSITISGQSGAASPNMSINNTVINNIFVNIGGTYAVEILGDSTLNNFIDYNCIYESGSTDLAKIGVSTYSNLSEIQTAWDAISSGIAFNDANSSVLSTVPFEDGPNGDFTLVDNTPGNTGIDGGYVGALPDYPLVASVITTDTVQGVSGTYTKANSSLINGGLII